MADLSFVQVAADSTGKRLPTTTVADGGSTMHQEIMVVAGGTGDIWEPSLNVIPSSSAVAMPVRVVTAATSVVLGSVALNAGSTASVAPTSQWTVTAALAAASTISAAPTSQWTVTAALAAGSTLSVAPTSQWTVTAALVAASTISVAPTTQWDVRVVGAGSSGVTGTSLISTGLTGAAIDPRIIAAQATSVVLGTVAVQQSTSYISLTRAFADSTANYNQKYFYTTGTVAAAAATMQTLHVVTNFSSGTDATSFNVAANKIFRIQHIEGSIRCTSGALLYADFAIRAVTTTGGATGTNPPIWYHRAVSASPTSAALTGGEEFYLSGLELDLPSSASFGVSIVSNSTASQECTFGFGGKEYTN